MRADEISEAHSQLKGEFHMLEETRDRSGDGRARSGAGVAPASSGSFAIDEPGGGRGADWERAHSELLRLAKTRAELDWEEGRWLILALQSGAHVRLGYGSFAEYVERLFGYSPPVTREKLRVAETLEELTEMSQTLETGGISWSAARELTRVATPVTEGEWLAAARGKTVRQIENLVSGHRPGDLPGDPKNPGARRHVLRFEVTGETLATWREAMGKIRRTAGVALDDDSALLLMARTVLEGPKDEGRASYQVLLNVCERCKHADQQARGEPVEVGPDVRAMAECDGQLIPSLQVESHGRSENSHVGDRSTPPVPPATQTIPPAIRRAVLRRDEGRCVVPGCRHSVFVDVHHLDPRSEGGDHNPTKLVTLCSAHHRAVHRGRLIIDGSASDGLSIRHADGTPYGGAVSPKTVDTRARAFFALRKLGFREKETRHALDQVASHVGRDATLETVIRQTLALLTVGLAHPVG